jgi:hypothetical protein
MDFCNEGSCSGELDDVLRLNLNMFINNENIGKE